MPVIKDYHNDSDITLMPSKETYNETFSKQGSNAIFIDDDNVQNSQNLHFSDDKALTLGRRRVLFKVQGKLTSPGESRSRQQLAPLNAGLLNTADTNNPMNLVSDGTLDTFIDQPAGNPMIVDI